MKILETSRTYLREMTPADAEAAYLLNLDPDVIKYTGDVAFESVAQAENFLKNYDHYQQYGFGRWAVINKSDGEFLGWCGLKYSKEYDEFDIGFRFFKKYWNKGYATETAKKCLDFGFYELGIDRIVGRAMKDNIASIKVLEKLGMVFLTTFDFDGHEGVVYELHQSRYFSYLSPLHPST